MDRHPRIMHTGQALPFLGEDGNGTVEAHRRRGDQSILGGGHGPANGSGGVRGHHGLHGEESEQSIFFTTSADDRERECVRVKTVGGALRMDGDQRSQS